MIGHADRDQDAGPGWARALPRRFPLIATPTPIERLANLENSETVAGSGVRLWVKRDDLASIGGGGNKLRKLEFLIADALLQRCDTFVTVGVLQSNHARLSAAACARAGLACELVLSGAVPRDDVDYRDNGNVLLDGIFGATLHRLQGSADTLTAAHERADQLRAAGRKPYVVRGGGSNALGSVGYAVCAAEIAAFEREQGFTFDRVVVPNGGSGTQAGLCAGFAALGRDPAMVKGFAVIRDAAETARITVDLAREASMTIGAGQSPELDGVAVDDSQLGVRYGVPTAAAIDAIHLLARAEGLLIDPVYGGKAFAGLLGDIASGVHQPGQNILFVMTGGMPSLFAYRSVFDTAA